MAWGEKNVRQQETLYQARLPIGYSGDVSLQSANHDMGNVEFSQNILTNDSDPEGDTITAVVDSTTSHGTLSGKEMKEKGAEGKGGRSI